MLLNVSVSDGDPARAKGTPNAVAAQFARQIGVIETRRIDLLPGEGDRHQPGASADQPDLTQYQGEPGAGADPRPGVGIAYALLQEQLDTTSR